jgi:hypothetical protein
MSHGFGMIIESLVAALLLLTIGYCIVLNRRLKRLKADEQVLHGVIAELAAATDRAERAISGLKLTVQDCDANLGERLRQAERVSGALEQQIGAGEKMLGGISGITGVAAALQPRGEPPPPDAKAMVAAAQAFAERARSRIHGRAA